jgi:hypothetical protein
MALQRSYLPLRLYAPKLDCFVSTARSQIIAVWRECDGGDVITVALQRSYLFVRLYAPELDCFIVAAGSQILAVWRECDGADLLSVTYKIWVSPIFQIYQISLNKLTVIQPSISYNTVIHICSCKFAFDNFIFKVINNNYSINFEINTINIHLYCIYSL